MAKTIDLTISIPNTAGAVRAQLRNVADLERIAHASGAADAVATVDGVVTRVVRTIEAPAASRAYLKADSLEVIEERTWMQSGADISITVTGFDISMLGHLALEDHVNNCSVRFVGTVQAHMGIVSPLAEGVIKERLVQAIQAECEALY